MIRAISSIFILPLFFLISCNTPRTIHGDYCVTQNGNEWLHLQQKNKFTLCYWFCSLAHGCDSGTYTIRHDSLILNFPLIKSHTKCYTIDSMAYYTDSDELLLYKMVPIKKCEEISEIPTRTSVYFIRFGKIYGVKNKSTYKEFWKKIKV